MPKKIFIPQHMNVTPDDLVGNQGIGRYIFLPGSDGRAKEIADHFDDLEIKTHPRGHDVYLGTIQSDQIKINVAAVSSGMGCPSTEIIVHELFQLGAKRFLRVGTAGSLQPNVIEGDFINVQASVRDEDTTTHYTPIEVPAIASLEFISSIVLAAEHLNLSSSLHIGTVHCKSALFAREMGLGPRATENKAYLNLLTESGVLASEMETATLFIQSQLYNHQLMQLGEGNIYQVLAGAILTIVDLNKESREENRAIQNAIKLALETVKVLAASEYLS